MYTLQSILHRDKKTVPNMCAIYAGAERVVVCAGGAGGCYSVGMDGLLFAVRINARLSDLGPRQVSRPRRFVMFIIR